MPTLSETTAAANTALESRYITVDGLPVHYRAAVGSKQQGRLPVVLVHGQVVSSRYMIPLAEHLAPDFQVYAPDLPGFGKSGNPRAVPGPAGLADALAAWMAALGLVQADLVGNSLGCNVLVELALRHGGFARRLVLQGPPADPRIRTPWQLAVRWLINAWREPSMGRVLLKDFRDAGLRRSVLTFRHLLGHPIEARLPRVQVPTLVLRGERDPIVPRDWGQQMVKLLPDGRLLEIPGAHTINYFAPAAFARVVREFLLDHGA